MEFVISTFLFIAIAVKLMGFFAFLGFTHALSNDLLHLYNFLISCW